METKETILVVDDETTIRRLLAQKLGMMGYHCLEAEDADQAAARLSSGPVELVVLDIRMPGKNGVELLREIKDSYPDTAVIMATAVGDATIAIECMKRGAYDCVAKPFSLDEIVLSIERALENRRLQLENRRHRQHLEEEVNFSL